MSRRRHLEGHASVGPERLAGLGQMAAQIAHELRNPLNAIAGAAQYLVRRLPDEPEVGEYAGLGQEASATQTVVSTQLKF